jgi:cell division protein FtsQ
MNARTPPASIEQYRKRKRRAGSIRWVLIALLLLACSACGYFFSLSPFFGVEQIEVKGNELIGTERVIALSGIKARQNIFTVDTALVERWLLIDPQVKSSQVRCRLPRTVSISVTERRPVAVLATGLAFIEIDESGLVLRRLRELDELSLPILSGISGFLPGVIAGSQIEGAEIKAALTVLNSLPQEAFFTVKEIDVADTQKIRLYFEGGIEVRVGDMGDMAVKYSKAKTIIYDAQLNGNLSKIDYIDTSYTEKPVIYYKNQ